MANMKCPICKGKGKILEDALQYEFVTRDAINSTCLYCMGFGVISPNKKLPDGRKAHEIKIESPDPAPTPGPSPKTRLNVSKKAQPADVGARFEALRHHEPLQVSSQPRNARLNKVLASGKKFLIITESEPYYMDVYMVIRSTERKQGTWTPEDEDRYVIALEEEYKLIKAVPHG